MYYFFLIWSPFTAFFLLLLLSNTNLFLGAENSLRILGAILLLPALISSAILLKGSHDIIFFENSWPRSPIDIGILLSQSSAIAISGCVLSGAALLFLMPTERLLGTLRIFALFSFLLILVSLPVHFFLAASLLALSSIGFSYAVIQRAEHNILEDDLSSNFLWQRLSDIFMFASLTLILASNNLSLFFFPKTISIAPGYIGIFFLSCGLRLIPMSRKRISQSFVHFRTTLLEDSFVSLGIIIILLRFSDLLFVNKNTNYVLIICAVLIFLRSAFNKLNEIYNILILLNTLLTCTILVLLCYKQNSIAEYILFIMILLIALDLILAGQKKALPARVTFGSKHSDDPLTRLSDTAQHLVRFSAESLSRIISPFYTNFLMYRLPQFIITLCQIPLRFFHNGSIQRSLIFIVISLVIYYWWWGR